MRHFSSNLCRMLVLGALVSSPAAFAAGSYTQSFSSSPSGWTSAFDTWGVTSGDYRNATGPSGNTVSWYTGRQWTKNLTYKVRAYSDWPGTGNELGVVFGLTDSTHYFEVLLSVDGQIGVFQVSGNPDSPVPRGTGSVSPGAVGLAVDTWFDLEVFVDATNTAKVEVKINGVDANMTNNAITPVAGYIGVVARSNKARFKNASVTSQLFRGNFTQDDGTAIDLSEPDYNCQTTPEPEAHRQCYARFSGVDSSGYPWPITLWLNGANPLQYGGMIDYKSRARTHDDSQPVDVEDYVGAAIETRPGHIGMNPDGSGGNPTHVLHQWLVKRQEYPDGRQPQVPLAIRPRNTFAEQHDLYMRFWLKYPDGFTDSDADYWQMPWQFVTDGAYVSDDSDVLRVSLVATKDKNYNFTDCPGEPGDHWHWIVQGDQHQTSGNSPPAFQKCRAGSEVPIGRWFKVEIFLHRGTSSSDNGRLWVAIDGHEVIDYNSSTDATSNAVGNMYAAGSPISRMNLPQMYGGDVWPRDQYVDDLEIWDGFPSNASLDVP